MVIKIKIYFIIIFFKFVNKITCETRELNKLITIKSTLSYRLYEPKNVQECMCKVHNMGWWIFSGKLQQLLSALMSQLTATK